MTTTGNNAKVHTEVVPVQRGPRYYMLLLLLFAWGILFLITASTALTQLSLPVFLAALVLLYLGLVLGNVYRSLNPMRTPVLTTPLNQLEVAFEDVVFSSRDGWMLSGWFIPSRKGPTAILTHRIGGNRLDLMPAASLLIEHGFGVLESIAKVAPRPIFLVASGEGRGPDLIHTYFESTGEPKEIWQVPEAGHGWISIKRPQEYGEKLCAFYQKHLIGNELIEYA